MQGRKCDHRNAVKITQCQITVDFLLFGNDCYMIILDSTYFPL